LIVGTCDKPLSPYLSLRVRQQKAESLARRGRDSVTLELLIAPAGPPFGGQGLSTASQAYPASVPDAKE
jgi:hypothetical protein